MYIINIRRCTYHVFFFFFSSRRRHTRFDCDWSSDVCSCDLIAPLLGLIGAVSGLVHVFSHLGLSSGASDTRQIALGIAEALNATVFGLSIAVPTLIGFSYFSRKVEVMSVEMETLVVELINKCY